ncbi:MAG: hypothetical protein AB1782_15000 [Cyanobacteriota bacterium]
MSTSGSLKNPVPLYNLLRKDVRDTVDGQVILSEDLYYRGVLILKTGTFLDDETIYRLLNFGFKKVNIILPDSNESKIPGFENVSILQLKKQYLKGQKCLVADKDGKQINELISMICASYIKETNIYAVNNSIPIKKLIDERHPKFVFIDLNLYPNHGLKVIKEVRNHTNAHLFLTALVDQSKTNLIDKLKSEVALYNTTLLLKPISSIHLRHLILESVTNKEIRKFLTLRRYLKDKFKIA